MKRQRVLATKIPRKLTIKNGEIFGISDNLIKLVMDMKQSLARCIRFEDIRLQKNNPHLKERVVAYSSSDDAATIYIDPKRAFEDDIAHEIIESKIINKYPRPKMKPGIKKPSIDIFAHLGNIIFCGLVDFHVERLVEEAGFDCAKSIVRDRGGLFKEWEKDIPYDYLPYRKQRNNWESLRNVEAGIILAQFWNILTGVEKDHITKLAERKLPNSLLIADLFNSYGSKGCKSGEEFREMLRDIIKKLNLDDFLVVENE